MALPLGSVKGTRETLRRPLHHSGAALPAKRDVQKRFLSGGCLSDSFDGDVETLMKFTNSEVEGFACAIASRVRMDGAGGCLRLQSRRRDWLGSVQGEHAPCRYGRCIFVDRALD